jgi:uncharacterized protein YfaT (DUF1175 family)
MSQLVLVPSRHAAFVSVLLFAWPLATSGEHARPLPSTDADGDGYPDVAELHSRSDRAAFLDWFALIAEAQAFAVDPRWEISQRDCAGLVRFAYRMALERHDARWLAQAPYLPGFAPEVVRFHVPGVPLLGDKLFRVGGSAPGQDDDWLDGFSSSATAERLVLGSARPLRANEHPERGDVLLFRSTEEDVAHVMVFLGDGRVVYHTGPRAEGDPGEVRIASLEGLAHHPDVTWRPVAGNPTFAGYFRWRIVGPGAQTR